jgi:hypothetical protein
MYTQQTIVRVAVLDLDGSGGEWLQAQVRTMVEERVSGGDSRHWAAGRDSSILYFSPDTSGNESLEGHNLVMNIFRPPVGCKGPRAAADVTGAGARRSVECGTDGGASNVKLSAAGTRQLLRQAIITKLVPCLRAYAPDIVIMSATYPAAEVLASTDEGGADVLEAGAPVPLTTSDYEWATRQICKVAGMCCKGRLVSLALLQAASPSSTPADIKGVEHADGAHADGQQLQACLAHLRSLVGC